MKRLIVLIMISGLSACATPQAKPVETVESQGNVAAPDSVQKSQDSGAGEVDLDAIQPEVIELGIGGSSTSPITVDVAVGESTPQITPEEEPDVDGIEETPEVEPEANSAKDPVKDPKKDPKKGSKKDSKKDPKKDPKTPVEEPSGVKIEAGDAPEPEAAE